MSETGQTEKVVTVRVGQRLMEGKSRLFFLFTAAQVEEVLPEIVTRPVPFAAPFLQGLTLWRGHLLPVVDLEKRFGLDQEVKSGKGRFLVVRSGAPENPVGRRVLRCMLHLSSEINPMELTGAISMIDSGRIGVDPSLVRGIYQRHEDNFIVPDLVSILQSEIVA